MLLTACSSQESSPGSEEPKPKNEASTAEGETTPSPEPSPTPSPEPEPSPEAPEPSPEQASASPQAAAEAFTVAIYSGDEAGCDFLTQEVKDSLAAPEIGYASCEEFIAEAGGLFTEQYGESAVDVESEIVEQGENSARVKLIMSLEGEVAEDEVSLVLQDGRWYIAEFF